VSIPGGPGSQAQVYQSPLKDQNKLSQLLPVLLDKVTANAPGTTIPARVNVNTAPAAVLNILPTISNNITASDVQNILSLRPNYSSSNTTDPMFQTPAWLITQANLTPATMKTLEKYITTRAQVFRVQSIGYFPDGGPTARVEAVIDTNAGKPRIIYYRDLTALGKGFDLTSSSGGN
jgi:hypothetical protein